MVLISIDQPFVDKVRGWQRRHQIFRLMVEIFVSNWFINPKPINFGCWKSKDNTKQAQPFSFVYIPV
jgi:hypothetical protein